MSADGPALRSRVRRFILRFFGCAAAALAVAAFCLAGCGKGGGSIAGREPVKMVVEVESDVDALGAWAVNKARASVLVHIDPWDDMAAFPMSHMEDMKSVAVQLSRRNARALDGVASMIERGGTVSLGYMAGMYERIIWVIPSSRPVSERPASDFSDYFIRRRGFLPAAVSGFKTEGAHITGTVTGVPLTITRLEDLALADDEDAIVDIDLAYFPATKNDNPAYRTGTRTLLEFLRELAAKNVRTSLVTVNRSTRSAEVPMDLRYYGGVIREALVNPGMLNGPMPDTWTRMIQAEDSLGAKRYASAAALYNDMLGTKKNDAGLYFFLAIAEGFQDKGPECRAALLEAYRLDAEYIKGFFQLARVLAASDKIEAGRYLIDTPVLGEILPEDEMNYQRGVFFYTAHKSFDAVQYLMSAAGRRPKDFGLLTILYRACREADDFSGQIYALEKLVEVDDGRVRREMPWVYAELGKLYEEMRDFGNASQVYEKHIQAKPGDSLSAVFRKRIDSWRARGIL
jgi:hypothetical protein